MFTITSAATFPLSRNYSHFAIQRPKRSERTQPTATASISHVTLHSCPSCGSPYPQSELSITKSQPHIGPSAKPDGVLDVQSPLSDVQKVVRMQDSMIDAIDVPVIAMWTDESGITINKALAYFMFQGADSLRSRDASEILSNFKVNTEDFRRLLIPDEYTIRVTCRSKDQCSKFKVGMFDSNSRRRLSDVTVHHIYDEETREFQAVLAILEDMTWYTDQIKAQGEQSEQHSQLICETLPRMVNIS